MMTWLQAQSVGEGYYNGALEVIEGGRPARNNNPLDLRWGAEAEGFGATHGDEVNEEGYKGYAGFAVFPDPKTGFRAAQRWLSVPARFFRGPVAGYPFTDPNGTTLVGGYLGATLAQVCYRFTPPGDNNNTEAYLNGNCERSGYNRTDILTEAMLQTPEAD
jgi:hypothetical protein